MLVLVETYIKAKDKGIDSYYAVVEKEFFKANAIHEKIRNAKVKEDLEIFDVFVTDILFHEAVMLFNLKKSNYVLDKDLNIEFHATLEILKENLTPEEFKEFKANTYVSFEELQAKYPEKIKTLNLL